MRGDERRDGEKERELREGGRRYRVGGGNCPPLSSSTIRIQAIYIYDNIFLCRGEWGDLARWDELVIGIFSDLIARCSI